MCHAVVAQHVSLCDHAVHKICFLFGIVAGEEKDGVHLLFPQGVQNLSGIAVLVPLVKGQQDLAAVGRCGVGIVSGILCVKCHRINGTVFTVHRGALPVADHLAADGTDRRNRKHCHCQQAGQQTSRPTISHLHSLPRCICSCREFVHNGHKNSLEISRWDIFKIFLFEKGQPGKAVLFAFPRKSVDFLRVPKAWHSDSP